MGKLNLPDGVKIWGANIVPKPAHVAVDGGQQAWSQMILNWDWAGWVKPQVDYLVGNGVGCNTLRMIGCNWGVVTGKFSQAAYDAKILQLVDYCASLGVYFYACGGGLDNDTVAWGSAATNAAMAESFSQTFLQMQKRPNVVGVDLIQETNNTTYTLANAGAMAQLVRQRGVTLPISVSVSEAITSGAGGTLANAVGASAAFDFIDVHLYPGTTPTVTNATLNYLRTTFPTKDVIIGEFGTSQGGDSAVEQSWGTPVLNLAASPDPGIRGALVWACTDQDNIALTSGNCFGVYDVGFVIRQSKANLLRRYTGGSLVKSLALHR